MQVGVDTASVTVPEDKLRKVSTLAFSEEWDW